MKYDELGVTTIDTHVGSAGVGRVVIPDVNHRTEYIEDCYRTNRITIHGGRGYGFLNNVPVDSRVMQNITFPKGTDDDNRGSLVVWIRDDITKLPVIVGVLREQDEYYPLSENQERWAHNTDTGNVEVFMDGNGALNIVVNGQTEAELNVKVSSNSANSVVNIISDGKLNVQSRESVNVLTDGEIVAEVRKQGETKASFKYKQAEGLDVTLEKQFTLKVVDDSGQERATIKYNDDGFQYEDEYNNSITAKNGEIDVKSSEIKHNSGIEPMVLGNKLVDVLGNLCDAISAITVTCSAPGSASTVPINAAAFAAIKATLNQIKSNKSKLE